MLLMAGILSLFAPKIVPVSLGCRCWRDAVIGSRENCPSILGRNFQLFSRYIHWCICDRAESRSWHCYDQSPPTSSIIASTTTNVETRNFASLHHHEQNSGYQQQLDTQKTDRTNKFARLKPGSLQAIMHAYKSAVTRWCHQNDFDNFSWQPRFYDRIIRADGSLNRIQQYIINNPAK